jgi:hypothetical protein
VSFATSGYSSSQRLSQDQIGVSVANSYGRYIDREGMRALYVGEFGRRTALVRSRLSGYPARDSVMASNLVLALDAVTLTEVVRRRINT